MKRSFIHPFRPKRHRVRNHGSARLTCWSLAWLLLASTGWARPQEEPTTESVLDRWLAAQSGTQGWSADVVQTRRIKTLTAPLVSQGKVWVRPTDQFRWELEQPTRSIVVRQSTSLLVLYPDLKRAERYPIDVSDRSQPWSQALPLLEAAFARQRQELDASFRAEECRREGDKWRITLEPRQRGLRRWMKAMIVELNAADDSLRSTELQFADGSSMKTEFSHIERNPPMDPALFAPAIPNDFEVVERSRP